MQKTRCDLLAVPVFQGPHPGPGAEAIDDDALRFLRGAGFEGKVGETMLVPPEDGIPTKAVLLVGLGKPADLDAETLRRAAGTIARQASKSKDVATTLLAAARDHVDDADAAQAVAEGFGLGAYEFLAHKGTPKPSKLRTIKLIGAGGAASQRGLRQGEVVARAVALARDLVNGPPGSVTPAEMARAARQAAGDRVKVTVWDEAALRRERLGGLLGVAAGSDQPPRLIRMVYEPDRPRGTVALVGKGITFDSGGLSLKPSASMTTMKYDMAGGAAVIATMSALAELQPAVRVVGIVPTTENMPSGKATKLGDVLHIRNGKTVEVLNTDAEGRLVLADGLALAVEAQPDAIVDLATLTGACPVALGSEISGLLGNRQAWIDQVREAAERAGERVWQLPMPDDYRKQLDSDVADIKNIGGNGKAGTIIGAMFLQEFVGDAPGAHLDIAGPAWRDSAEHYLAKGGTGWGVRTLVELVLGFRKPPRH